MRHQGGSRANGRTYVVTRKTEPKVDMAAVYVCADEGGSRRANWEDRISRIAEFDVISLQNNKFVSSLGV